MRFLLLTQYYPPEPGAASLRLEAMAQELTRHGHAVAVVTAKPHHLGARRGRFGRWPVVREEVRGIPVLRTWIWRVPQGRFWLRLLNYFSFVITGFWGLLQSGRPDFLIVESPPLFLGITAYVYHRLFRVPYILSVSDLWPESAVALGLVTNRTIIGVTRWLELFLYRHAAFVSGVTEGICQTVAESGLPAQRVLFFPNGVDPALFRRVEPGSDLIVRLGLTQKKIFLYPGTVGYAQGLDVIVEAADILREQPDIVFLLVGDGPVRSALEEDVARRGLKNVRFEPLQPVERMAAYFSLAQAVIVPLRRHKLFRGARPSKVFPAWAVGIPVIFSGEGEMADLIDSAQGGVVVPPEDAGALAMAVDFMARLTDHEWQAMGQNGHRFVMEHYTWSAIVDRWLKGLVSGG
ncbi:MAG: glycosyltransferase family 4 protein [Thermaerobacter sp.]|nr:glycosyltransferase family 4 protein [Thermaerobacter sp.]